MEIFLFITGIIINIIWIYVALAARKLFDGKLSCCFVISAASVLVISVCISTLLSAIGCFTLMAESIILLVTGIAGLISQFRHFKNARLKRGPISILIPFIFLIIFVIYIIAPTTPFAIGRDPSAYFVQGIHIAQTGKVVYDTDAFYEKNFDSVKDFMKIEYGGFYDSYKYGVSQRQGGVTFQFLNMFPSGLAIGYAIAGIPGLQAVNAILGIAGLMVIYWFVFLSFGRKEAIWAVILLGLNPAQIYSARITQSELLCQMLLFLGFAFIFEGMRKNISFVVTVGSIILGLNAFNRIDMYLVSLAVYIWAIYVLLYRKDKVSIALNVGITYGVVSVLGLVYSYLFSYPYLEEHFNLVVLKVLLAVTGLFMLAFLIIVVLRKGVLKSREYKDPLRFVEKEKYRYLLSAIIVLFFLVLYYIRPLLKLEIPPDEEGIRFYSNAVVEFCFYVSAVIIPFSVYGFHGIIKEKILKNEEFPLFMLTGLINLVVYLWQPTIASDHIWASRRWITVCIPYIFILGVYGFNQIYFKYFNSFIKSSLLLIILVITLYPNKAFILEKINNNILLQYEHLAKSLDEETIYICNNKIAVLTLRGVFRINNVYWYEDAVSNAEKKQMQKSLSEFIEEYGEIHCLGKPPAAIEISQSNIGVSNVVDWFLYGEELERARGKMPDEIVERKIDLSDHTLVVY